MNQFTRVRITPSTPFMTVIESGRLDNEGAVYKVAASCSDEGIRQAIIADVEWFTHYWVIEDLGHTPERILYVGTPETFEKWQKKQVN